MNMMKKMTIDEYHKIDDKIDDKDNDEEDE